MPIIIIEGHDLSGKNTVADKIAQKTKYKIFESLNLHKRDIPFWDDKQEKWPYIIQGDTEAVLGAMKCFNEFIKIRFHLSEYVYSTMFNRKTIVSFQEIENKLLSFNKEIFLFYLDINYDEYKRRYAKRGDELLLQEDKFNQQRQLFTEAYHKSKLGKHLFLAGSHEDEVVLDTIIQNL
jgi:thymidylate kinase